MPLTGLLLALAAGLAWGLVFICPLVLPDYPPVLLSMGRYVAFGLIALPIAWLDRRALGGLRRADWIEALKLAAVGNLLYYLCLSAAIQQAGGPLPTMIIGALPVVIPVAANLVARRAPGTGDAPVAWASLLLPLAFIAAGIVLVQRDELHHAAAVAAVDVTAHAVPGSSASGPAQWRGALLAIAALACWTWYPVRNSLWLRRVGRCPPATWATAQGLATLPLAVLGYGLAWLLMPLLQPDLPMPLGPRPGAFVTTMLVIGLVASWLGTLCWNGASRRLSPTHVGPLMVFETLAALLYAYVLRGAGPGPAGWAGIVSMVLGVLCALRMRITTPAVAPSRDDAAESP